MRSLRWVLSSSMARLARRRSAQRTPGTRIRSITARTARHATTMTAHSGTTICDPISTPHLAAQVSRPDRDAPVIDQDYHPAAAWPQGALCARAPLNCRTGHEPIEGCPELRAIAILFLQDFVPSALDHAMRSGRKPGSKCLDRHDGHDAVATGRQCQDR